MTYLKLLGGFCHREVAEAGAQKQLLGRHWFGWAGRGQLDWMEEDPFRHERVRSAHGTEHKWRVGLVEQEAELGTWRSSLQFGSATLP